jgi:hypothetical protein
MKPHLQQTKNEHGQALVEFAAIIVILMVLLLGLLDLGRAFFTFMALQDAAQEGATYASIKPGDSSGIVDRVRYASDMPVDLTDATQVNVSVNPLGSLCAGNAIEVVVEMPAFAITTPLLGTILGSQSIPLRASVTDTILTPPCQ